MVRSVAVLLAAMQLSRPGIPKAEALRYADALNRMAEEVHIDPLLAVAIVHFESRWYPTRISEDREDYGLGQVRARYLAACREDEDPLNAPSEACFAAKVALLDGVTNLQRMGAIIAANKVLCREKIGSEKDAQWLAGYQGYNAPEKNHWCKPGEKTYQVLAYHAELMERFFPRRNPAMRASASKIASASKGALAGRLSTPGSKDGAMQKPVPRRSVGYHR
ncbi:MAG: hypothetical protein RMJ98_15865 [Myxococcales bacterium]|nr:hypothetical protein [Polyangiaceae bacterium]MDW8250773.1 hypothetical protein [Myxococcales bacterium]